ncbi:MAG: hypothetical protein VW262_05855 [Flavobacteriaceae bacterium]
MGLGYKQKELVRIGEEKGFVTVYDVAHLYPASEVSRVMNALILQGYFEKKAETKTGILYYRYVDNV